MRLGVTTELGVLGVLGTLLCMFLAARRLAAVELPAMHAAGSRHRAGSRSDSEDACAASLDCDCLGCWLCPPWWTAGSSVRACPAGVAFCKVAKHDEGGLVVSSVSPAVAHTWDRCEVVCCIAAGRRMCFVGKMPVAQRLLAVRSAAWHCSVHAGLPCYPLPVGATILCNPLYSTVQFQFVRYHLAQCVVFHVTWTVLGWTCFDSALGLFLLEAASLVDFNAVT
jgi:hypothetical protein